MAKRSRINVTQEIDPETGEIIETKKSFIYDTETSRYTRLYSEHLDMLTNLNKSEFSVLIALVRRLSYNSDKVYTDHEFYIECEGRYGISKGTIHNALSALIRYGLVRRYQRGVYGVTPHIFWRGSEKERLENL